MTPSEQQEEDYCKPKRTNNFSNNNQIEYKNNGDRIETNH